jgi:hypothetical protein
MRRDKASFKDGVNAAFLTGLGDTGCSATGLGFPLVMLALPPRIDPMRLKAVPDETLAKDHANVLRRDK